MQQMTQLRDSLFEEGGESESAETVGRPGRKPASVAVSPSRRAGGKAQRGELRDQIFAALQSAGSAGVRVQELASALATKPVNIHSWFHSAIKRYPSIKKLSGGHYALQGSLPEVGRSRAESEEQGESTSRSAATTGRARRARGGGKSRRGELSASILDALREAGSGGITVKDLSDKLKMNYKNVYIWFATTGKKNPSVKKVGPAQYRLA